MLDIRKKAILKELMENDKPITGKHLGNILKVSSRTVRSDIKELNEKLASHGVEVKSLRGIGYELKINETELFKDFLREISEGISGRIPSTPEDRIRYLIRKLLLATDYQKLEDLADEIFVSRSTLQNDLKDVREILEKYQLEISIIPHYGLKVIGEEMKMRFCISEYVFNRGKSEVEILNSKLLILSQDELETIQTILLDQVKKNGIVLSDIALNNLIIHIAIACKRIRNENYISIFPQELDEIAKQKEYSVASKIVTLVEEKLKIEFPPAEVAYVGIHLMGTRTIVEQNINEESIEPLIGQEISELTEKILGKVEGKMQLGIRHDRELAMSLSLHLKPAINRQRYGMNLRNPMLDAIKESYPVAFEAGVIAGIAIEEEMGFQMNENEIAYLALHFGGAMERAKVNQKIKSCIIVCASGVGSARLLYYRLQAKLGSQLNIIGTTEYYNLKKVDFDTIDFIISTIPIHEQLPIPVIEVNTIPNADDLLNINQFLDNTARQLTIQYLQKDLVFLQQSFETRDEVIHFLCHEMEKQGLVDQKFYSSVTEREQISPTSFGNLVAIPHPMIPQTEETLWAICTLQKPIMWGEKRVQFICLLSVQKTGGNDLQNMYNVLGKIIENPDHVQQLLDCKTYEEFKAVI